MKKIILVDGTNLVFRSYYATAYSGSLMKNSKGFPTNAVFGFINMIQKIILEEKPSYMVVAFDKGKTFRHEQYKEYKAGRSETPDELKKQMPKCKEILDYLGITHYELDNYEADDIIGTFANLCDKEPDLVGTIISSDKDLLQLITKDVDMKLLKSKDYIRYSYDNFKDDWQINPANVVDLKALMGDSSDNIPGVSGIGEKTAIKLLSQYETLDNLYVHIDEIKGKLKEKLINDKDQAYLSYSLATINKNAPLDITLEDVKVKPKNHEKLNDFYSEMEFYSLLKKEQRSIEEEITLNSLREEKDKQTLESLSIPEDEPKIVVKIAKDKTDVHIEKGASAYLEILGSNYHTASVIGLMVYHPKESVFIPKDLLSEVQQQFVNIESTYDFKKMYVALKWLGINMDIISFDTMVAAYLLDYNIKDDIAYFANSLGYSIPFYDNTFIKKKGIYEMPDLETVVQACYLKAQFIYSTKNNLLEKLKQEEMMPLFEEIEMPLTKVLGDMEYQGVIVDKQALAKMRLEINEKISLIEKDIYNLAGREFNISSPRQLGDILFDVLGLPHGKKGKNGYSTNAEILEKLKDKHPIISCVLEYRMLTKLKSTYIDGLEQTIMKDGKIHTIFTNTLTRTGRLSSIEPNLQNIPIRNEYGKMIREAFLPSPNNVIVSGDYSQVELRILAHMANVPSLIEAFKNKIDIHTKTASDIFNIPQNEVTKTERRIAKAVNFGIIYGISSYGLATNAKISNHEAKEFIDNYLHTYPGVKEYMDTTIAKAHEVGYVRTLMKRKRIITELANKNYMIRQSGERIALNTPIQGTSADLIKKAMVNIHKRLQEEKMNSKMILQIHDELIFDAPKEELDKLQIVIKEEMEHVITLKVPLEVEISYGDTWCQAK